MVRFVFRSARSQQARAWLLWAIVFLSGCRRTADQNAHDKNSSERPPPEKITFSIPGSPTPTENPAAPATVKPPPAPTISPTEVGSSSDYPRPVVTWLEVQIALARHGISGGAIDGIRGPQSAAALAAFQSLVNLPRSGELDAQTQQALTLQTPPLTLVEITSAELGSLHPLGTTWLEKSEQTSLAYESALEMIAERFHTHPNLVRLLNQTVKWDEIGPGVPITVPAVQRVVIGTKAARVRISLGEHTCEAFDEHDALLAHFPVSIARQVEKRPVGELHVVVVIPNPDYTFDPDNFPESAEARELGRKLILPPGPNNPVGVAWVGLDRPGYGIHGTPLPEQVGRTESHGCFRLANWDALTFLSIAWPGLPVEVNP